MQLVVHGFDSFEGLPEDWYNGQYSINWKLVNHDADNDNGNIMADDVSSIDENRSGSCVQSGDIQS